MILFKCSKEVDFRFLWILALLLLLSFASNLSSCSCQGEYNEEPRRSERHSEFRKEKAWETLDPDAGIPPNYDFGKPGKGFVQKVVSFNPAGSAKFGQDQFPQIIQGAPQGSGNAGGSFHVLSLGCGGSITLEFSNPPIANGSGYDFIIFENAFGEGEGSFTEPAQVSVSINGKVWHSFPCKPSKSKWPYPQCAGSHAVYSNSKNKIPPHDHKRAGGDAFDLSDLKLPYIRFIKIVDKSKLLPDAAMWCGSSSAGFDLDAIAVIWSYRPSSSSKP